MVALSVDCRIGPYMRLGHTDTMLSPFLFPYSKASLSASVFERQYQFCGKKRVYSGGNEGTYNKESAHAFLRYGSLIAL